MNSQILEPIRKECAAAIEDLLKVHESELDTALEMNEGILTISASFKIDTTERLHKVKSSIAFPVNRVKDEREVVIDDGQSKLFE